MTPEDAMDAGPSYVELIDGRMVARDAEEWRHECEARAILSLPTLAQRRAWLEDLERRRGKDEADRLKATMLRLHAARA
mgnify:CR=1 FL=1